MMGRACLIALMVLAGTTTVVKADSGVKVLVEHRYYSVRGDTAESLRQQLNERGVNQADGGRYDAITNWGVGCILHYRTCGGECTIRSVDTTVHVAITLPRWEDFSSGPWPLQDEWNRYMRALREHEDGHKQHAIMAAQEIAQAISNLGPCSSPQEMEAGANGLVSEIFQKYIAREHEYDARTGHGLTQGAAFPHEHYYAQSRSGGASKPKRPKLCHFLITTTLRP